MGESKEKKREFREDAKEAKTAEPTQISGRPDIPEPKKVSKKKEK